MEGRRRSVGWWQLYEIWVSRPRIWKMSTRFGSRSLKHRKKLGVFSVWNIETLVNCKSSTRLLCVSSRKMRLWRTWPQVLCHVTRFSAFLQFPGCPKTAVLQAEQKSQSPQGSNETNMIQWFMHVSSDWATQTAVAAAAHLAVVANREAHAPPMQVWNAWCYLLLPTKPWEASKNGLAASTWVVQVLSKNMFSTPHFPSSDPKTKWYNQFYLTSIEISTSPRWSFCPSVRPSQLLPIGPRSPKHPDSSVFLLLDGRWFKSVENKKTDWKKGWHKEPTCKGWLVHILSSFFLLIHCFTWFLAYLTNLFAPKNTAKTVLASLFMPLRHRCAVTWLPSSPRERSGESNESSVSNAACHWHRRAPFEESEIPVEHCKFCCCSRFCCWHVKKHIKSTFENATCFLLAKGRSIRCPFPTTISSNICFKQWKACFKKKLQHAEATTVDSKRPNQYITVIRLPLW